MKDVLILGAGITGATAAWLLRDAEAEIVEAETFLGGRTYSESYPGGIWANYGAGYFSADKFKIFDLADEVGVELLKFDDRALVGDYIPDFLEKEDIAEIRNVFRRIQKEQANRRAPTDPSLDQTTVSEWLGELRPNARFYLDLWAGTMSAPLDELSMYGLLLMHGVQRVSAFTDDEVSYDPRGNVVVKGGNGVLAEQLIRKSGLPVRTGTRVRAVVRDGTGYRVRVEAGDRVEDLAARTIICTLPASVALEVCQGLPDWKRTALGAIRYGRILAMPVVVGPAGTKGIEPPAADFRRDVFYCETDFAVRSPTDLETQGAYFVCQVYDRTCAKIWEDDDDSIRAGVYDFFKAKFPDLAGRVLKIGIHRWEHAIPKYTCGRMAATPDLVRPVDGLSFCGDYTDLSHTHGAAMSAERAVAEVRAYLARTT